MPDQPEAENTQSVLTKFLLSIAVAAGTAAVLAACEETKRQLSRPAKSAPRLPIPRKAKPSQS